MLIQLAAKLWLGPQQIDPSLLCYKRRSILRLITVVYNYCLKNVRKIHGSKLEHYLWWGVGANLSFSSPLGTVG